MIEADFFKRNALDVFAWLDATGPRKAPRSRQATDLVPTSICSASLPTRRSTVLHAVHYLLLKQRNDTLLTGYLLTIRLRSTFPRPDEPTARARTARSTPSTRLPVSSPAHSPIRPYTKFRQSTRLERLRCSRRVSVVMTASSPVTEVRPSPSSTRYDQFTDPHWISANELQRAKTTKKVVLRLECTQCKTKAQVC
jgi:hypothetical protein